MAKSTEDIFWIQLLAPLDDLSPAAARVILRMKFGKTQVGFINRLVAKSRQGALSADEKAKLESYLQFGNLLGFMHSKARMVLRRPPATARRKSA
jgi:hypothetical protein